MKVPLYIGGKELHDTSQDTIPVLDPGNGEQFAEAALGGEAEVDLVVSAAKEAFEKGQWARMQPADRGRIMHQIAQRLLDNREVLARLEVQESGKPLRDAYWEIDCSARFFEFYGGFCDKHQGTSVPLGPGYMDWTVLEPIGVSLHIVPWNYPLQVAVRGVAPALATGCSVIIKPATETPVTAWKLAQICSEAGLPPGTINVITGPGSVVGTALAAHPGVDQITFTGSVATGQKVMAAASTHTIPVTMELGGKSPQIVFDDADLDRILPIVSQGMFCHAGQVCNAGTRLIVADDLRATVSDRLHAGAAAMTLGHGFDDPDMGPVISRDAKSQIEEYLEIGRPDAERVLVGAAVPGEGPLANGSFVSPVILDGVSNTARVAQEEIFGPILTVIPFDSDEEAIEMANQSEFGLVAGVFTSSIDRAMAAAERLRAGQVWINSFGVGLDVEFPFGGYKRSGFGREKGLEALGAYTQVKNISVAF
jgi:aldehyde dehydrogenase (NAD+)